MNYHNMRPAYVGHVPAELYPDDDPWECLYSGQFTESTQRLAVVCLLYGTKYSPDYVRRLAAAVRLHLPWDHDFYCLTDNAVVRANADAWGVKARPLPPVPVQAEGWWYKVGLFARGAVPHCRHDPRVYAGTPMGMYHCEGCGEMQVAGCRHSSRYALYLDLDVVVRASLLPLLQHAVPPDGIVMAENFGPNKPHCPHNSSVMLWQLGTCEEVYTDWTPDVAKTLHGDQCWLWRRLAMKDGGVGRGRYIREFRQELVRSYKYDCRDTCGVPPGAAVVVFHGKPDPHEVRDPWVVKHWHSI